MVRYNQVHSGDPRSQWGSSRKLMEPRAATNAVDHVPELPTHRGDLPKVQRNLRNLRNLRSASNHDRRAGAAVVTCQVHGGIPGGQNSTRILGNTSASGWEPEEGLGAPRTPQEPQEPVPTLNLELPADRRKTGSGPEEPRLPQERSQLAPGPHPRNLANPFDHVSGF